MTCPPSPPDTFAAALGRLTGDEQKQVKLTVYDLQTQFVVRNIVVRYNVKAEYQWRQERKSCIDRNSKNSLFFSLF